MEILIWKGKDKIILFESEKYEFSFKLKKETFLLLDFNITELKFNHDASFLVFSIIQNNSRTLYIYRKNDFLNEYRETIIFEIIQNRNRIIKMISNRVKQFEKFVIQINSNLRI